MFRLCLALLGLHSVQRTQEEFTMPGSVIGFRGNEETRFWTKVILNYETDCWEWTAAKSDGYGIFGLARDQSNTPNDLVKAHRWAYEYLIGPIPNGLEPDHTCRNPSCVNPFHLELVTPQINKLRGNSPAAWNAITLYCKRGHNAWRVRPDGKRECTVCRKMFNDKRPKNPLSAAQQSDKIRRAWTTRRQRSQP